jgi:hypothetical protein
MVPEPLGSTGCYFQVSVWDSSGRLVYDAPAIVDEQTTSIDPFFCDGSLGIFNETGYLTMGTVYNIPTYNTVDAGNYLSISQTAWMPNAGALALPQPRAADAGKRSIPRAGRLPVR